MMLPTNFPLFVQCSTFTVNNNRMYNQSHDNIVELTETRMTIQWKREISVRWWVYSY